MASFGERLKLLREKEGLLQKELAAKTNVAISTLASWESGYRVPELGKVEALADFFHCSVDYLLGRTDIRQAAVPGPIAAHNEVAPGQKLDVDDILAEFEVKFKEWKKRRGN